MVVAPGNGRAIVTEIINDASGIERPYDIAVDGGANVYVAGADSDNAFKITPGGVITEIINLASGLNGPVGIAVDRRGNVYVAGSVGDSAFKIGAIPVPAIPTTGLLLLVVMLAGVATYRVRGFRS